MKFIHEKNKIGQALGISELRERELDEAITTSLTHKPDSVTQVFEMALKLASVKRDNEILYIGFHIGAFMGSMRATAKLASSMEETTGLGSMRRTLEV